MLKNRRGQSILEYSFIGGLVILGVIIMGPYVIRSIHAHFKMWDDQIQDSHGDRFIQPKDTVPDLPTGCTLTGGYRSGCGGQGITTSCAQTERIYVYTFNPPGCYYKEHCDADETCCTGLLRGDCGTAPLPPNFTPRSGTLLPVVNTGNGCYYGERTVMKKCGNHEAVNCINDASDTDGDSSCQAKCTGTIPTDSLGHPTTQFCPGTNEHLQQDTPITLLAKGAACTDSPKCQTQCAKIADVQYVNINGECKSCGNDVCDASIGETSENCPSDCIPACTPQRLNDHLSTSKAAGQSITYTSDKLNQPANISVHVFTDDLEFEITFYDAQDKVLFTDNCSSHAHGAFDPRDPEVPSKEKETSDSCYEDEDGGWPFNAQIDGYRVTALASKVKVWVKEGGESDFGLFGYTITATDPLCAPTCSDKVRNQNETGVDCGGPCPACVPGTNEQTCTTFTKSGMGNSNTSENIALGRTARTYAFAFRSLQGQDSFTLSQDGQALAHQNSTSTANNGIDSNRFTINYTPAVVEDLPVNFTIVGNTSSSWEYLFSCESPDSLKGKAWYHRSQQPGDNIQRTSYYMSGACSAINGNESTDKTAAQKCDTLRTYLTNCCSAKGKALSPFTCPGNDNVRVDYECK